MPVITQTDYDAEIERLSEKVLSFAEMNVDGEPSDTGTGAWFTAIGDAATDVVENHRWFADDADPETHAKIIEHSKTNTRRYVDWKQRLLVGEDTDTPLDVLRKLAYLCMVPDIMSDPMDEVERRANE